MAMRFVSFISDTGFRTAGVRDDMYVDLNATDPGVPTSMKRLLAQGERGLDRARRATEQGQALDPESVTLAAPVPDPEKIICIGLNYADHAAESGVAIPSEPVVFNKFPTAVCGPGTPIVLPVESQRVDYEAELVIVIGAEARHVSEEKSKRYIAGYTCGNDVSARDWQLEKPGGQWLLGKSFDTFAPIGPILVTSDEVDSPGSLDIRLRLNGQCMQDSNTQQLIFCIEHIVSYISRICTLKPGDIIFTGTPPGVGMARKPPVFLKDGDVIEVEIEGLGVLRNMVVSGSP
jgi:2-keto-4-pentenoate hydratase/2-oxohepta-3-ene-1,7-dioic acid hydratase in catechol pathway